MRWSDFSRRARRLPDLLAMPAMPLADVAIYLDLPLSTLDKLRAEGRWSKLLRLGRRLYCLQADLRAWLERMAAHEAE